MRALGNERYYEEQKRKKTIVLSAFMLAIIVISTAGYAFLSQTDEEKENSGQSENNEGKWVLPAGERQLVFANNPTSVQYVPVDISVLFEGYAQKPLYLVSDDKEVINEIATTLGAYTNRVQRACYGKCNEDFPEKTCTNSSEENIIIFKAGGEEKVFEQENCVFIEGNLTAVDAFLFRVFGINL